VSATWMRDPLRRGQTCYHVPAPGNRHGKRVRWRFMRLPVLIALRRMNRLVRVPRWGRRSMTPVSRHSASPGPVKAQDTGIDRPKPEGIRRAS